MFFTVTLLLLLLWLGGTTSAFVVQVAPPPSLVVVVVPVAQRLVYSSVVVSQCTTSHRRWGSSGGCSETTATTKTTALLAATTTSSVDEAATSSTSKEKKTKTIPIHLLAGFLGAGKTTFLKHLLENTENLQLGIIVNDVASINIDAKLVKNNNNANNNGGEMIELQNGCACCSLSDELLVSLENLVVNKPNLNAILVELSGVADPVAIQNVWKESVRNNLNLELTTKANLSNIVTLVDACTFGTDYMTFDVARDRWQNDDQPEDCSGNRKVVELLSEQVEAAQLVVINKEDLASDKEIQQTQAMVSSLNEDANVLTTSYGQVSAQEIVNLLRHNDKDKKEEDCHDPDCTDTSHSHSHDHAATSAAADCDDPDCTDTSHSHSHDHAAAADCNDPDCTDTSHSHSHDHAATSSDCDDPDCTDTSHSHSHDHATAKTNVDSLGISNFVYQATRPFDAGRLMSLLYEWPVPVKDKLDLTLIKDAYKIDDNKKLDEKALLSPFVGVLRSKGFCWFAPTEWDEGNLLQDTWRHNMAMYWSHAGKHLGVTEAGRWWDSVPEHMMKDFFADNPQEYARVKKDDFVSDEWGDRRQELVFIGVELKEDEIRNALDKCLLTDEELIEYRKNVAKMLEQQSDAIDVMMSQENS